MTTPAKSSAIAFIMENGVELEDAWMKEEVEQEINSYLNTITSETTYAEMISGLYEKLEGLESDDLIAFKKDNLQEFEMLLRLKLGRVKMETEETLGIVNEKLHDAIDKVQVEGGDVDDLLDIWSGSLFGISEEPLGGNVKLVDNNGDTQISAQLSNGEKIIFDVELNEFNVRFDAPSKRNTFFKKIQSTIPNAEKSNTGDTFYVDVEKNASNMRPLMQALLKEKLINFTDVEIFQDAVNEHSKGLGLG